mmetsp:Transcript_42227/g.105029  ORF Transcript_42227/g.105029 Transcript_42227/m.105029 type:complete len:219 (-) Transcript_42227:1411-2067(-)
MLSHRASFLHSHPFHHELASAPCASALSEFIPKHPTSVVKPDRQTIRPSTCGDTVRRHGISTRHLHQCEHESEPARIMRTARRCCQQTSWSTRLTAGPPHIAPTPPATSSGRCLQCALQAVVMRVEELALVVVEEAEVATRTTDVLVRVRVLQVINGELRRHGRRGCGRAGNSEGVGGRRDGCHGHPLRGACFLPLHEGDNLRSRARVAVLRHGLREH